jgi:hypothetical protein
MNSKPVLNYGDDTELSDSKEELLEDYELPENIVQNIVTINNTLFDQYKIKQYTIQCENELSMHCTKKYDLTINDLGKILDKTFPKPQVKLLFTHPKFFRLIFLAGEDRRVLEKRLFEEISGGFKSKLGLSEILGETGQSFMLVLDEEMTTMELNLSKLFENNFDVHSWTPLSEMALRKTVQVQVIPPKQYDFSHLTEEKIQEYCEEFGPSLSS